MLRPVLAALFALVVLFAPRVADATDFQDHLDDFSVHIDPDNFIACTTYPVDQWDKVDCDGLNKEFEAAQRAKQPGDTILVGASVYRTDTWGFRVRVLRGPWIGLPFDRTDDARAVEDARERLEAFTRASGVSISSKGIESHSVHVGDAGFIRSTYELDSEPPVATVNLAFAGEHALYLVELVGPRDHAQELGVLADRVAQTVHVRPAPNRSGWMAIGALSAIGIVALVGTLALFVILARSRPSRRSSAVSWPSVRD